MFLFCFFFVSFTLDILINIDYNEREDSYCQYHIIKTFSGDLMVNLLHSAPPKKQRIINAITDSIRNRELPPGGRIASVRDISQKFDVSPSVVHRALKSLTDDGMIECRGGQGFYVATAKEPALDESHRAPEHTQRKIPGRKTSAFLCCGHHSDLTWKYSFAQYEKIREHQWSVIADFLEKHRSFHVYVEQSEAIRPYLQKHPEHLELFADAAKDGRLSIQGGFAIPDLNLCSGELLVRNLQKGCADYEFLFGKRPLIACMDDAFGMCAQLPQVLKKSGYEFLSPGRRPNFPHAMDGNMPFLWKGIDDSAISVVPPRTFVSHLGYEINVPITRTHDDELAESLNVAAMLDSNEDFYINYMTEESEIQRSLFFLVDSINRSGARNRIEFGSPEQYCQSIRQELLECFTGEFNPVFSGCYTTRITVKQQMRHCENELFAAEMLNCAAGSVYDFSEAWRELMLCSFHDAVCGCHTDEVYQELCGKFETVLRHAMRSEAADIRKAARGTTVFNPGPAGLFPAEFSSDSQIFPLEIPLQRDGDQIVAMLELPEYAIVTLPAGKRSVPENKRGGKRFETDFYSVDFSSGVLPEIRSRTLKENPFGRKFGEIVFRRDTGTLWSEALSSPYFGTEYCEETLDSIEEGELFIKVTTSGHVRGHAPMDGGTGIYWDGFQALKFTRIWRFYRHADYFTLQIKLDFRGSNTKVSLRMPLNIDVLNAHGTYDVPFGAVVRQPYMEVQQKYAETCIALNPEDYPHAAGDYPAQHFVDYTSPAGGVSVANNGSMAYQMVNGEIFASLLRSGTMVHDGFLVPQQGSFDNGEREYFFAVTAHESDAVSRALLPAALLNRKVRVLSRNPGKTDTAMSLIRINHPQIRLSSLRPVATGEWIARIYDALGSGGTFTLSSDYGSFTLLESDLTEKEWRECPRKVSLSPFEIKTLKIVFR